MTLFPEIQDLTTLVYLNASSYPENISAANGVGSEAALSAMIIFWTFLYFPINPQPSPTTAPLRFQKSQDMVLELLQKPESRLRVPQPTVLTHQWSWCHGLSFLIHIFQLSQSHKTPLSRAGLLIPLRKIKISLHWPQRTRHFESHHRPSG